MPEIRLSVLERHFPTSVAEDVGLPVSLVLHGYGYVVGVTFVERDAFQLRPVLAEALHRLRRAVLPPSGH